MIYAPLHPLISRERYLVEFSCNRHNLGVFTPSVVAAVQEEIVDTLNKGVKKQQRMFRKIIRNMRFRFIPCTAETGYGYTNRKATCLLQFACPNEPVAALTAAFFIAFEFRIDIRARKRTDDKSVTLTMTNRTRIDELLDIVQSLRGAIPTEINSRVSMIREGIRFLELSTPNGRLVPRSFDDWGKFVERYLPVQIKPSRVEREIWSEIEAREQIRFDEKIAETQTVDSWFLKEPATHGVSHQEKMALAENIRFRRYDGGPRVWVTDKHEQVQAAWPGWFTLHKQGSCSLAGGIPRIKDFFEKNRKYFSEEKQQTISSILEMLDVNSRALSKGARRRHHKMLSELVI
jgi:hypothetical protein